MRKLPVFFCLLLALNTCAENNLSHRHIDTIIRNAGFEKAVRDVNMSLVTLSLAVLRNLDTATTTKIAFQEISQKLDRVSVLLYRCINNLESYKNENPRKFKDSIWSKYDFELRNYSELMGEALQLSSPDQIKDIVDFLDEDLGLKHDGSFASSGNKNAEFVNVRVRVFDRSGKNELPGYSVFLKP